MGAAMSALKKWAFLVAILGVSAPLGLCLGFWLRDHVRKVEGPRVEWLTPREQRIVADPGTRAVVATYRLLNTGDRDLELGAVTTTCGCSVASIDRRLVAPRQSATIVVEGDAPDAGPRVV